MLKKNNFLALAILILVSLIAFSRILSNDFINYDDNLYITENHFVQSGINPESIVWAFTSTHASNWHPLTWLTHILDWEIFGAKAGGHHLVNLIFHIGSVVLLFLLFYRTTRRFWPAFFVAALFALHPLRVESVAWAAERKDVLSLFFGLGTLNLYVLYVEKPDCFKYAFCLLLFALGLMAKPMLVTLPFVMMLIDYWPLCRWKKETAPLQAQEADRSISAKNKSKKKQREEPVKKIVTMPDKKIFQWPVSILWEKAPFIFLAVVSSGLTIWVQTKGGAVASLQKFPFTERAANSVVSYVTYLWKAFCPINLAVFYPYQNSLPAWQIISAIFILLAISVWAIYTIKKTPYIFTGWFWYLGTMIPVIGLVQVGSQAMADRYTYLPSIGLAVMLVWWIIDLIKSEKIRKNILLPAGLVIVLVLSVLTWRQCGYWKNNFTLYEHALKVTENNDLAHYNLGNALKDQERMDEALHQYQAAVKIRPSSDGHNNIGIILELYRKEYDEAIYHYQQALKITPQDSGIHFNYGMALFNKGNLKEAIEHFRKVIELNPNYEAARRALKLALEKESGQNR